MIDYKKYINALRKCAKEHENDKTFTGHIVVSDLCQDTANLLEELEQKLREGHWIEGINKYNVKIVYCSECKNKAPYAVVCGADHYGRDISVKFKKTDYCPTCGIKMENAESEEQNG